MVMQSEYAICAEEKVWIRSEQHIALSDLQCEEKLCGHFQGHESPSQPLPVIISSILDVVI